MIATSLTTSTTKTIDLGGPALWPSWIDEVRSGPSREDEAAAAVAERAEVIAVFTDPAPLLGPDFERWALEELATDNLARTLTWLAAADYEAQAQAKLGITVRPEGGVA
jgi:hypothetical protein